MITIDFKQCGCCWVENVTTGFHVKQFLSSKLPEDIVNSLYLTESGKLIQDEDSLPQNGTVHCTLRTLGGKGGFGSMLRAIGAQIEKTTNREACRDLSGRRLRDINEEKRLKKWISEQSDRDNEKEERKKKKLQKLCSEPKFEFSDKEYDKMRSELTDKVYDAVEQGLKTAQTGEAGSSGVQKKAQKLKAKGRLWIDDDLSEASDSDESDTDTCSQAKKPKLDETKHSDAESSEASSSTSSTVATVDTNTPVSVTT